MYPAPKRSRGQGLRNGEETDEGEEFQGKNRRTKHLRAKGEVIQSGLVSTSLYSAPVARSSLMNKKDIFLTLMELTIPWIK